MRLALAEAPVRHPRAHRYRSHLAPVVRWSSAPATMPRLAVSHTSTSVDFYSPASPTPFLSGSKLRDEDLWSLNLWSSSTTFRPIRILHLQIRIRAGVLGPPVPVLYVVIAHRTIAYLSIVLA